MLDELSWKYVRVIDAGFGGLMFDTATAPPLPFEELLLISTPSTLSCPPLAKIAPPLPAEFDAMLTFPSVWLGSRWMVTLPPLL